MSLYSYIRDKSRTWQIQFDNFKLKFKDSYKFPLISIVVPLYNEKDFLSECLESIQKQSYKNWECIIVNDASTDSSPEIAKSFCEKDSRFRLVHHEQNKGLPAARNTGIRDAKGEYITFLDSDDYLIPPSLWKRALVLHRHAKDYGVAGVYSRILTGPQFEKPKGFEQLANKRVGDKKHDYLSLNGECPFCVHSVLMRKDVVVAAGGFREELKWGAEDWDLWQRLLRNGYVFLPSGFYGGVYRQKKGSMVRSLVYQHCSQAMKIIGSVEEPIDPRDIIPGSPFVYERSIAYYHVELVRAQRLMTYYTTALLNGDEESKQKISKEFDKGSWAFLNRNLKVSDVVDKAIARQMCISVETLKAMKLSQDKKNQILEDIRHLTN